MAFRAVPATQPPASTLIEAMYEEILGMYGHKGQREAKWLEPIPGGFDAPGGACLVGEDDGVALCVGGLRDLGDGVCEIKRMYVVPEARGNGVARLLLAALEHVARDMGYARVRLDTGPDQPHARRLYERSGYVEIPDYNGNAWAAFWGEKEL
ncbi:MAG TPA: GNAT family N-acetyltransferase [Solirubrobacteraceae bacterium]|nr:GNAT family N-acetyltransferase [Solirubrobacteraceae bacterium]